MGNLAPDLGQTKVQHLDRAVGCDLDVARLEVAVNEPLFLGSLERFADLPGDRQRLVHRYSALLEPVGQREPFDEFRDEVV